MSIENLRTLRADEIICRVNQVVVSLRTQKANASILLYKDARVDQRILDECVGPTNWQRTHRSIDDNLYCTISIWDAEKNQWVGKEDVGTESNTEAEKGQASDSFKRAGFNWGIGRELYSAPNIYVELDSSETTTSKNGKPAAKSFFKLRVSAITYNDKREIQTLSLVDMRGKQRYSFDRSKQDPYSMPEPVQDAQTPEQEPQEPTRNQRIKALCAQHNITVKTFNTLLNDGIASGEFPNKQPAEYDDHEFDQMMVSLIRTLTTGSVRKEQSA